MKTANWIMTLAAAGAVTIASSQASALSCGTPAGNYFGDVIWKNTPAALDCQSRSNAGQVKRARATGGASSGSNQFIHLTLQEGNYGWVGGYNSQGVQIDGCVIEDTTPQTFSLTKQCPGVAYFDLYVANN